MAPEAAYGYLTGAGIAKGRIAAIGTDTAAAAPGVLTIVTAADYAPGDGDGFHAARPIVRMHQRRKAREVSILARSGPRGGSEIELRFQLVERVVGDRPPARRSSSRRWRT